MRINVCNLTRNLTSWLKISYNVGKLQRGEVKCNQMS